MPKESRLLLHLQSLQHGAFKQMEELGGQNPLALLELKSEDLRKMRHSEKIAEFVKELSPNARAF